MKQLVVSVVVAALFSMHCSAPPAAETESATSSRMVKTIASSYGITTFGGPGDRQSLACGGNSSSVNQWYAASSQRYGCHVHLQLNASNGKCVVVSTEDAGPATFVENNAGMPILDASPAVAQYLFGTSGLGWSDVKADPGTYSVTASETSLPVGPCDAPVFDASSSTDEVPASTPECGSDGQCNPGNDGSGLICEDGACVPGCRSDAQCPDNTVCVDGDCE